MVFTKEASTSTHNLSLPRENTPLLHSSQKLSSVPKTFANVFIAIVGAGVLGLPYTFMKTGWLSGVLMLFFIALLTYHCMMLLVHVRRKLESEGYWKIGSFGDLGYAVCGSPGRMAVDLMIVLSQAGFCASYLIFISNSLVSIFVSGHQPRVLGLLPKSLFIWGILPFQLAVNSIKRLTNLAPLSIFADVVNLAAMGAVMAEDVVIFLEKQTELHAFSGGWGVLFYGLGVAVYAFEGIGMVLPLEAEAENKEKFGKVLAISMAFISVMYGAFGALGYFAFGDKTKDIITTNFGKGLGSDFIQIALAINLFFSFPLMMNPVHEVMERRISDGTYSLWLRWLVVLVTTLVALLVPNFADFLSLVGSSVCCLLGFVLPALFHMLAFRRGLKPKEMVLDSIIIFLGIVFAVSGTVSSLMEIFFGIRG
ncbi:amino acid transporter AVT3B-like [Nymphaea colorata]|nr:amino acid transporter AVT3B-like [Nymphaea colorata]